MDVVMQELFSTDIGLLSLFTIGFIIAMAIFLFFRFYKKSHEGGN
jgi:hypothetical protein